ncbi:MAG: sigma-70 family RNA polymerase sigma factor [Methylocystis sp.]
MRRSSESLGPLSPSAASELIFAIAEQGDREAFVLLFSHYFPRLKSFLMRSGTPDHVAEELAQETMLRVWRRAGSYNPSAGAPSTWIFVIARNLRVDHLRGERSTDDLESSAGDSPDPAPTGEGVVLEAERRERLQAALASLSSEQASIVRLSFFEDRSHSEIAESLGMPLGTVKSRVRLALARLRAQLGDLA